MKIEADDTYAWGAFGWEPDDNESHYGEMELLCDVAQEVAEAAPSWATIGRAVPGLGVLNATVVNVGDRLIGVVVPRDAVSGRDPASLDSTRVWTFRLDRPVVAGQLAADGGTDRLGTRAAVVFCALGPDNRFSVLMDVPTVEALANNEAPWALTSAAGDAIEKVNAEARFNHWADQVRQSVAPLSADTLRRFYRLARGEDE